MIRNTLSVYEIKVKMCSCFSFCDCCFWCTHCWVLLSFFWVIMEVLLFFMWFGNVWRENVFKFYFGFDIVQVDSAHSKGFMYFDLGNFFFHFKGFFMLTEIIFSLDQPLDSWLSNSCLHYNHLDLMWLIWSVSLIKWDMEWNLIEEYENM